MRMNWSEQHTVPMFYDIINQSKNPRGITMSELLHLVCNFRKALEAASVAGEFYHKCVFSGFPKGCCGDTCDLLGQYLISHGIKTGYTSGVWYGSNNNQHTHAWLVREDGLVIDITGDQFSDDSQFYNFNFPVYIGEETTFHQLFQERSSRARLPFHKLGCMEPHRLPRIYNKIMKYLPIE